MLHSFVEVTVIQYDRARSIGISQCDIIIKYKFEGRIANEVALHLYAPIDSRIDDVPRRIKEDVYLLVNIYENLILVCFATDRYMRSRWVDGIGAPQRKTTQLLHVEEGRLRFCHLAGDQRFDVRGIGKLRMPKIDDLVQYLIDKHKIFPYSFLIDDPTEIFDDDYYAIEQFQDVRRRYVEAGGCNYVDGWFFKIGEIDAFDVEDGLYVALGELDLSVEELRGVFDEVGAEVAVYYGVSSSGEEKYLGDHYLSK